MDEQRPPEPSAELVGVDDCYRWALEQAALIRAGRFSDIDIVNVAEEIEDVGKSELRAFRSNLESILVQMLKWNYQAERRTRSWKLSIFEHRNRVHEVLMDSASMAAKWDEVLKRAYLLARSRAARETTLPSRNFPPGLRLRSIGDHGSRIQFRRELI